MSAQTHFANGAALDHRFCGECGTLLPLPAGEARVQCLRCGITRAARDFEGVEAVSSSREYAFQKPKARGIQKKVDNRATIDETCPKCGRTEMTFTTAQLRSADEGQTIFYHCVCGYKTSLNS